ncbi:hypothetical protein CDL12_03852 [Handroanthus impetiginosus]|uniref:Uncharacterized protein n=1 Tax=Handroanthus impetiginosus TaxID=429701 RepID=A0A2G9I104_9LAMI|nr:hypothetical protein CDL12_03852 [Handroanthus impetiginosus]
MTSAITQSSSNLAESLALYVEQKLINFSFSQTMVPQQPYDQFQPQGQFFHRDEIPSSIGSLFKLTFLDQRYDFLESISA